MSESITQTHQRAWGMDTWKLRRNQMQAACAEIGYPINLMAKTPFGQAIGTRAENFEALYRWVEAGVGKDSIYLVLNPSSPTHSAKPGLADITDFEWLLLDFDPYFDGPLPTNPTDLYYVVQPQLLEFFKYLPTHIAVDSGRGLQIWLKVDNNGLYYMDVCNRMVKGVTKALKAFLLTPCFKLDDACAELSHLARLPGTLNHKVHRAAKTILFYNSKPLKCTDLMGWIEPPPEPVNRPSLPAVGSKWYEQAVRNGLSVFNRDFLRNGVDSSIESRHKRAFACAKALFEVGCDSDLAAYLLYGAAEASTPSLNLSDPGCIRRLVKEIWKT